MRVLIVDDTISYRSMLRLALSEVPGIEIVGTAPNGKLALQKLEQTSVDVVIMDIEMPEMDGLEAVRIIKEKKIDCKVIMFSALTKGSAEMTMKALHAGADDLVAKPGSQVSSQDEAIDAIRNDLAPKIKQFDKAPAKMTKTVLRTDTVHVPVPVRKVELASMNPEVILIASSTGGPAALEQLFTNLGSDLCPPILIAQHMPPVFTKMLSDRIERISRFKSSEGQDGMLLQRGNVYVAPGDYHMELDRNLDGKLVIRLNQGPKVNSVRPAADLLFKSAARVTKHPCVSAVLTGMGEDGCLGAQAVKETDGYVFIQDEGSSVVWGMPGAVHDAGYFDSVGDIKACYAMIDRFC